MRVSRDRIHSAATAAFERTTALLEGDADAATCASCCTETSAALEAEHARFAEEGSPAACAAGCAFCCHQRVSVFPHEALALLHALRAEMPEQVRAAVTRRIRANAERVDAMTIERHYAANLPCAFLVDGRCSAYLRRPSICASFHSMSRARCEQAFDRPEGMGTPRNSRPVLLELQAFADAIVEATGSALASVGVEARKLELHQALRALLDDPEAAGRWRAGGAFSAAGR
jgi:Fe-S-cluster containining protein